MKQYTEEELELMSYDDIAFEILKEHGQKMKIKDLFNEIAVLLKLTEKEYENHIADFFELLSTDKRFIMLDNGYWDLRVNHSHKIIIEDEDEDYIEDVGIEDEDEEVDFDSDLDSDDDKEDDDLKDLVIVSEDEDESESML